tara:strand:- start:75 stop:536 length:462 start_codon:yes stop_codon:yes gene_type:complete
MNWEHFHDMNYMFVFLSNYGDGNTTEDELQSYCSKLTERLFERDIDGDGIVDSSLSDDEIGEMVDDTWNKYGSLDDDGKVRQFFTSAGNVAKYFGYHHGKMQAFVNDMVDVAAADGYIDGTEEEIINRLADAWGCSGVEISFNAGVPVFLFLW